MTHTIRMQVNGKDYTWTCRRNDYSSIVSAMI